MTRIDLLVTFERQLDQRGNSVHASANVMIIERILHQSIQFHRCKLQINFIVFYCAMTFILASYWNRTINYLSMELDAIALSLDYRLSVPHHQRIAPSLGHDLSLSFFLISLLQWNRQKNNKWLSFPPGMWLQRKLERINTFLFLFFGCIGYDKPLRNFTGLWIQWQTTHLQLRHLNFLKIHFICCIEMTKVKQNDAYL